MSLDQFLDWLQATAFATAIGENSLLFPWIECVHVLAITLVVGTIFIVDLRLLGVASMERPISAVTADILPWTWVAFGVAAITGASLFSSNATTYGHNVFMRAKIALLALAGLNMIVFHLLLSRDIGRWDSLPGVPIRAKIAGLASIALWIGVVTCGRWVGFTMLGTH